MAASKYAQHVGKRERRPGVMERSEYLSRRSEFAPRGQDLPHSKLLDMDIIGIRSAARQRESLRKHIAQNLSNAALAKQYGTHVRNIEKIISREAWSHIA